MNEVIRKIKYDDLKAATRRLLIRDVNPTPEKIRSIISEYRVFPMYEVDDDSAEKMAREFEISLDVSMDIGSVIVDISHKPWLPAAKASIVPFYWDRYKEYLEEKDFPHKVIAKLDDVTERILGLLGNPLQEDSWDRRGMVVGHVQSGKTANYTGVICKAADAGYKLIIVIAGIHNNLRNQTQMRIDEGFIGRDSARIQNNKADRYIGVGKIDNRRSPIALTNSIKDFNKAVAESNSFSLSHVNEAAVLVIKKNVSTLKNVIAWLSEYNSKDGNELIHAPMLLIDDEADNASIDISKSPDKSSTINSLIRTLLNQSRRSCYIGYTATPFANIFIDPSNSQEMIGADLFPKDFIVGLDAPDNYMGANKVFSFDGVNNVSREIIDNDDFLPLKHRNNFEIVDLPDSLKKAIRTFVVCRAIRILRGDKTSHNSMLVNSSRFTSVQAELRNEIHSFLGVIQKRIRYTYNDTSGILKTDTVINALFEVWQFEYSQLEFSWDEVVQVLHEAAAVIRVIEVNSKSASSLDYENHKNTGLNVIAIGGFSLSRGLTLEGLSVSYFLRNSIMYDTLLQMGRWFGYRPGYSDLCRIWLSPEAEGWYEHISESIEELRDEIRKMEKAKLTPKDFGLKVRSHPDSLIVTARNKMGSGEKVNVKIGLANRFIETSTLSRDPKHIQDNKLFTTKLIQQMGISNIDSNMRSGNYLWKNVNVNYITQFISSFKNHFRSFLTTTEPVVDYITERNSDELKDWDVVLISLKQDGIEDNSLGVKILRQNRSVSRDSEYSKDHIVVTNSRRIASPSMEAIGIDDEIIEGARNSYRNEKNDSEISRMPGSKYREIRTRPLLILHLLTMLKPKNPNVVDEIQEPLLNEGIIGWSISFPKTNKEEKTVDYMVNTTWWNESYPSEFDEEDEADD